MSKNRPRSPLKALHEQKAAEAAKKPPEVKLPEPPPPKPEPPKQELPKPVPPKEPDPVITIKAQDMTTTEVTTETKRSVGRPKGTVVILKPLKEKMGPAITTLFQRAQSVVSVAQSWQTDNPEVLPKLALIKSQFSDSLDTLEKAVNAFNELPDDFKPKRTRTGTPGRKKNVWAIGDKVRIAPKFHEAYQDFLGDNVTAVWTIISVVNSEKPSATRVGCKCASGMQQMFAQVDLERVKD